MRATSQQGFKANHNLNVAKLINRAFQVRGCILYKVKYRLKELKAGYKIAKMLVDESGWVYDPLFLFVTFYLSEWFL